MAKKWVSFDVPTKKRVPLLRGMKEKDAAPEKVIKKKVTAKGSFELEISYVPRGMWYKEITRKIDKKDAKVITLDMPDSGVILEPGKPMLPIEGLFVALPAGAELVDIKVVDSETMEYPGEIEIIPAPEPSKDGKSKKTTIPYDQAPPEFNRQKDIYDSDEEYPKELFKIINLNYIGSLRVAHLMMYPLHYKPKSKKLIIYNRIELLAEYTPGISIAGPTMRGPSLTAPAEPPAGAPQPVAPAAPQIQMEYKDQILNLEAIDDLKMLGDGGTLRRVIRPIDRGKLSELSNKGRYLIITNSKLTKTLKKLAKMKEDKGWSTKIVTDEEIYKEFQDTREEKHKAIRDFILYAYDNWDDPPEYVVIVGEIKSIPTHHHPDYNCPSDWYYSNLIGDIGPDIVLGRIAINDPNKLEHYIKKVEKYEKSMGKWTKRALFTAYNRNDYMECSDDCVDILKGIRGIKTIKKYGGQASKQEVIDEIEEGCGIINYRGHGSEWEWQSDNGLDVNDALNLQNDGKVAVVFSICCLNSAIDVSAECFGESFIEAPNGAVAFLGASRPSYTYPNHHFDRYIFRAIVDRGLRSVGKIFNYATMQLYRNFPDQYTKENIAMYLLLGDPAIEIKIPR